MTIFIVVVFSSFFVGMIFIAHRMLRMSASELEASLRATEDRLGLLAALSRAPLGGLVASAFGALTAVLLLILDYTDALYVERLAFAAAAAWVCATALAISSSYWGRPRAFVHPSLRDKNRQ
jgi:hypothetical protein